MDYKYFIFDTNYNEKVGCIEHFPGINRDYLLTEGEKMGSNFKASVELTIAEDSGNIITDFVENLMLILVVSDAVKDKILELGIAEEHIEWLPFVLKNKNGIEVKRKQYYVANLLRKIDCLDHKRSEYRSREDGSKIIVVRKLYLEHDKIPEDARLFRVGEYPEKIILRSDLIEEINAAGLTGLCVLNEGRIR